MGACLLEKTALHDDEESGKSIKVYGFFFLSVRRKWVNHQSSFYYPIAKIIRSKIFFLESNTKYLYYHEFGF